MPFQIQELTGNYYCSAKIQEMTDMATTIIWSDRQPANGYIASQEVNEYDI